MMLARFRSIGWVAAAAVAVLCCYLISLRVATERGALESLEYKIAMSQKHIRLLQTELGTRGQMNQLERWNEQALALAAPEAEQFLPDAEALVALTERQPALPMQEDTQLASVATDLDVMPVTTTPTLADKPALRTASYEVAPVAAKLMQDRSVDDRSVTKSDKAEKLAKADKSAKTEKSAKAEKVVKSDKADKAGKALKGEKLAKSEKPAKADKAAKTEKSAKSDKPSKADKLAKTDKPAKAEKSAKADKSAKDSKTAKSSKGAKSSKDKPVKLASLAVKGKETRRP